MISVFFVLYVGVELGFSGWVYTYARGSGHRRSNGAAWLTATFWAFFALGRLLGIPLAAVVRAPRDAVRRVHPDGGRRGAARRRRRRSLVWLGTALLGHRAWPRSSPR